MDKVFIVTRHENYGFNKYHEPMKKAFLTRESVIEYLKEYWKNENSDTLDANLDVKNLAEIEDELYCSLNRGYGDYHCETEEISLINFE